MKKADIDEIYRILKKEVEKYDVPIADLIKIQTKDPFKVLIATILSARTKDKTTAAVCERLFKEAKDLKGLKISAIKSSIITHSHPAASAGAIVMARAIAFLIDKDPKTGFSINEFFDSIIGSISGSQEKIWEEFINLLNKLKANLEMPIEAALIKFSQAGVKSPYFIEQYLGQAFVHPYTISTVICSIFIFLKRLTSFKECIFELATAGGDSDTVGAIGGSLAGVYFGLEKIPSDLIKLVKNNKRILKISEDLFNKFKKKL